MNKLLSSLPVLVFTLSLMVCGFTSESVAADPAIVKIGLNYPETGPYAKQGLDQKRAAELAVEEINAAGGILGKNVTPQSELDFQAA